MTTMGIDDVANKYLVEKGILGLRRVPKADIRKIAKSTGATVVTTMATPEGDEVFESSLLGSCERVHEEAVGDNDMIFFSGLKSQKSCTILLRGANEF